MFKQFSALIRGRAHERAEQVVDRNAMVILRQQIRDCGSAVTTARKAVAVAIAQNDQEIRQFKRITAQIADLETRIVCAIEQHKDDLAREAAETLSILEAERDTCKQAQDNFEKEIERLKRIVRRSEMRLRELQRGQRIVAAADKTQRLHDTAPASGLSVLKDAEATLSRLRQRQTEIDATNAAMDEMNQADDPARVAEKLAEAGCGAPLRSSADEILARLSKRAKTQAS